MESHEWLGSDGTVGITERALGELGEIVYIELPKLGQKVHFGDPVCVLESTKAAIDIHTPASGTVVAVNDALRASPQDLSSKVWLFRLDVS